VVVHESKSGFWKVLMALSLVMLPLLGSISHVSAQDTGLVDDSTYVLELNGDEIEWESPWEYAEDLNYVDDGSESVGFISGAQIQSILYLPSGIDLEDARDSFLEAFAGEDVELQTIDRGAYSNVSYSLDLAQFDDILFGLFTVYIDDDQYVRSYATLAPYTDLGDAVDDAADSITINGETIYSGVEGSGLQDLVDANAGDFAPTDVVKGQNDDDAGDDGNVDETPDAGDEDTDGGAAEEYLGSVRDNYGELADSVEQFNDLLTSGESLTDDDIQTLRDINTLWLDAPDAAAELTAPDGYEDVQEAYENYAQNLADGAEAFNAWTGSESGSDESAEALDEFNDIMEASFDLGADLDDVLTAAEDDLSGSSNKDDKDSKKTPADDEDEDAGKKKTPVDDDEPADDGDADAYLETVRDNYDELSGSVDRFLELFGSGESLTDKETTQHSTPLDTWLAAPDDAADLDAPKEFDEIQATYEDYTDSLSDAGDAFVTLLGSESGTTASDNAADDFAAALQEADGYGADLDDLLSDAGV
jgi:hypothetical protein